MNFNLIQVRQLNAADISGYILEVVSPYTGISSSIPSGAQNQVLVKSGVYSAGSNLFYVNGKFGFGTAIPTVDFHLVDKNLTVEGTGVFDTLFVGSSRVITNDELNASGQFLQTAINTLSGFLTSNYYQTGQVDSLYYPRTNPSGFVTSGQTGIFVTSGQTGRFVTTGQTGNYYPRSNPSGYITGINSGSFVTSGQTGTFASTGWVEQNYYPRSNPSGYGAGGGGGSQTLSFNTGTDTLSISSGNSVSLGQYLTTGEADARYTQTGSTGIFVSTGQTGAFYSTTNPSGYITGLNTGNFITSGQTGDFYSRGNPSGYIQSSSTGTFTTTGWVNQYYYPRTNPSGYGLGGGTVGTGIGQRFEFNTYTLTSGEAIFGIQFVSSFPSIPVVVGTLQNLSSPTSYSFSLSGISETGFYLLLSDSLTENTRFNYYATTGSGQFTIGATATGTLVSRSETGIFAETGKERLVSSSVSLGVDNFYVGFTPNFSVVPKVFPSLEISGSVYYYVTTKEVTVSGYRAVFSDIITEDVTLHSLAKI